MPIFTVNAYIEADSPAEAVLLFVTGDPMKMNIRVDDPDNLVIPDDISGLEDDGEHA